MVLNVLFPTILFTSYITSINLLFTFVFILPPWNTAFPNVSSLASFTIAPLKAVLTSTFPFFTEFSNISSNFLPMPFLVKIFEIFLTPASTNSSIGPVPNIPTFNALPRPFPTVFLKPGVVTLLIAFVIPLVNAPLVFPVIPLPILLTLLDCLANFVAARLPT